MQTILDLPDDLVEIAQDLAAQRHYSLSDAVEEIMRLAMAPPIQIDTSGAFPKFVVPADAKPITDEAVREALEDW